MDLSFSSDSDNEHALLEAHHIKLRREKHFKERDFNQPIDEVTRKQRQRVPEAVIDYLVENLSPLLQHGSQQNQPLSVREQLEVFLHFLGTNGYFHLIRDAKGPSTNTIFRTVHRVSDAMQSLKDEVIKWPEDCSRLSKDFMDLGGFPATCGCVDGTHVEITPSKENEITFVNRHHGHSLNVIGVCGPECQFYYINSSFPGRCHDSYVLKHSWIWQEFEERGHRPFEGAVILGDSGYPLKDWLMVPFPGDPDPTTAKGRFNSAHIRTRNCVERAFGQLKNRFSALKTGLRLKNPAESAKIVVAAAILHNLSIKYGDKGDDLSSDDDDDSQVANNTEDIPIVEQGTAAEIRERRRMQLLAWFQR